MNQDNKEINPINNEGFSVIFFYSKDGTTGCTKEVKDFQANLDRFNELKVKVIGVSSDSVDRHKRFSIEHNIDYDLISDTDHKIALAFDVFKEKNMYGKKVMGNERSTFIINNEGKIIKKYSKVKVDGHVEKVIQDIMEFTK
ncbi:peroxiredoxin [Caldicellulosiruptoraceae bacterium PP1]